LIKKVYLYWYSIAYELKNTETLSKTKIYYIVDDDVDDQHFLMDALMENDRSVKCYTAANGEEAIANLQNKSVPVPDVIFLDLNMPRMNERQCLAELKQLPDYRNIPVIICSTTSHNDEIRQTMENGASYFLVKNSTYSGLKADLSSIALL